MSRTRYKQVAKQLEGDRLSVPHFARFGLRNFRFRFRLLGGLVSVTFWLRFLLRSRLVPAMSLETWFPLRPKWFSLHPAPHHGQTIAFHFACHQRSGCASPPLKHTPFNVACNVLLLSTARKQSVRQGNCGTPQQAWAMLPRGSAMVFVHRSF